MSLTWANNDWGKTIAIVVVLLVANPLAISFGLKSKRSITSKTFCLVFSRTTFEPLITRETVARETPASLATSYIVTFFINLLDLQ